MPFIQVTMLEGRTSEQKHALIKALTDGAQSALGAKPESVRVAIYEVTADDWGVAGEAMSVLKARGDR